MFIVIFGAGLIRFGIIRLVAFCRFGFSLIDIVGFIVGF